MGTMNISLPDSLRAFVDQQVSSGAYGTSSEYLRELIRHDRDRLQLRAMLLEGAKSPVRGEADAAYFQALRDRATGARKPAKRHA
jgi:antitoxin ParD1/3/4